MPVVALVGGPFMPMAQARAISLDYPSARLVEFEHPIAGTDEDSVREKGARLVDDVIAAFLR